MRFLHVDLAYKARPVLANENAAPIVSQIRLLR